MRASPSWPNHFPKAPSPKTITLGIKFQYMNWGGPKHSVYSTQPLSSKTYSPPMTLSLPPYPLIPMVTPWNLSLPLTAALHCLSFQHPTLPLCPVFLAHSFSFTDCNNFSPNWDCNLWLNYVFTSMLPLPSLIALLILIRFHSLSSQNCLAHIQLHCTCLTEPQPWLT